jgi:capsular polysaccharide biosynthesis protein
MMSDFKKFIGKMILVGLIFAAAASVYTLFIPKVWEISGEIVIVPSGSPASASQNLSLEAANAAEMIKSPSFQKNVLGEDAKYFSDANPIKDSSTVGVNFETQQDNIQAVEDIVVKIPNDIASFSRDIYQGSPFNYLTVSDPKVSAQPVKPNMVQNVLNGFILGVVLFILYWLWVEPIVESIPVKSTEKPLVVSPSIEILKPWEKSEAEAKPEEIEVEELPEKPTVPEERLDYSAEVPSVSNRYAAPDNLPVAGAAEAEAPIVRKNSDFREPTDEEVKERLNKLMRGEL